ncbi:hypothetical protein [Sorangium sp. So ce388]|uniref:hypothetical protein n=1 Tax=Sorangium sp. So ce388 TaxID=3133309 RepID=UPI003F5C3E57
MKREGEIRLHDTHVAVWEEHVDEEAMLGVWMSVRAHLERRGFSLEPDELTERTLNPPKGKRARAEYMAWSKSWSEKHRQGRNGGLEFTGGTYGRQLKIEFFQNVANVENRNGGRYDFGKFARMPRALRTRCAVEMVALIRHLQSLGYTLGGDLREPIPSSVLRIAEGRVEEGLTPLERFNRSWVANRFTRGADGWPVPSERSGYGAAQKDRDGIEIAPGDIRAVYNRHRLVQGRVYPAINDMWTLRFEDGSFITQEHAGAFFTPTPSTPRRLALTKQERIAALDGAIQRATRRGDVRRAERIRGALTKLTSERLYYVLSLRHSKQSDGVLTWCGPDNSGYVFRLEHAGRYLESEIAARRSYYDDGENARAIPCDVVAAMSRTVREVGAAAVDPQPETDRVVRYRHKGALKRWQPASATTEAA